MKTDPISHKLFLFLAFMLFSLAFQHAWAADISVSVDRNPVSMNESFKIYFDASDSPEGEPDFSPLENDFTVLNQGQSSNSSWINGQYSKSIRWTVEAMAKKAGNLTIPAISFGSDASKPLPITVGQADAGDADANVDQDLFLQVKAESEQPYVQSQVLYTVKLYRRVDIAQASLSEPELPDAVVEKLGEDSNYNTLINGVSYLVTERKYAIFPQKSGVLTIKPLTLTAEVVLGNNPRSFSDFFGSQMTKTKRVLSNAVTLTVKPAPAAFNGKKWLPAEKLELAQTWSGDTQQMKAGEPLTRTLTLKGVGTTVGQLPGLNALVNSSSIKAYSDQPVLNEQKSPDGVSATRQEKVAVIPFAPGKQILPAIEIPWFNIKTNKMEVARIPETTLNVAGGASVQNNAPAPAAPEPSKAQPQTAAPEAHQEDLKIQPREGATASQINFWPWLSLFLGLGWLSTVAYFLNRIRSSSAASKSNTAKEDKEKRSKDIARQLQDACQRNDALAAKTALLTWGRQEFGASSLGFIAEHCEDRLRDEILALNLHLYGRDHDYWQGKTLFQAFSDYNAINKIARPDASPLEPLHLIS